LLNPHGPVFFVTEDCVTVKWGIVQKELQQLP
jgi:hypothetical protein